jgi:hypothetical protein
LNGTHDVNTSMVKTNWAEGLSSEGSKWFENYRLQMFIPVEPCKSKPSRWWEPTAGQPLWRHVTKRQGVW